jgi:hypothetical protein
MRAGSLSSLCGLFESNSNVENGDIIPSMLLFRYKLLQGDPKTDGLEVGFD